MPTTLFQNWLTELAEFDHGNDPCCTPYLVGYSHIQAQRRRHNGGRFLRRWYGIRQQLSAGTGKLPPDNVGRDIEEYCQIVRCCSKVGEPGGRAFLELRVPFLLSLSVSEKNCLT